MRFFVTGHTGFKGAWLVFLLNELGHEVVGFSDNVESGSLFETSNCESIITKNYIGDVRDIQTLRRALGDSKPDFLIHMAAQSLVRRSFFEPADTLEINVGGTVNVLNAAREMTNVRGALIVTTDKVYAPNETKVPHREYDPLKGFDPYSSSKVLADEYTQSWIQHVGSFPVGIARAGNVIGGGDICADRLVPEVFRSMEMKSNIELRFPNAIRPWQHVLDCLFGYIQICAHIFESQKSGVWNIGPEHGNITKVSEVCDKLISLNSSSISWKGMTTNTHPENHYLSLDSDKAKNELGWSNLLGLDDTLIWTSNWYKEIRAGRSTDSVVLNQLGQFLELASQQKNFKLMF
jgi:CDP-glucose 4,6-dehydratase